MKKILFGFYSLSVLFITAQTNITTNIFANTSWPLQGSPYVIKNDLIIHQGATLTVESGVEIKIDAGFSIELRGGLIFDGKQSDSILIHSSTVNPSQKAWYGITFNSIGKLIMNYTLFKDAEFGIEFWNADTNTVFTHSITNSRFTNNTWGISGLSLSRPKVLVEQCVFNSNLCGIRGGETENMLVKNSTFFSNYVGIGDTTASTGNINVDHCEFFNNKSGAHVYFYVCGKGSIKNSFFHNNINEGLALAIYCNGYSFTNNQVYSNKTGILCAGQTPSMDSLDGGNSSICNNLVDFENATSRNFKMKNICWCTNDSASIRAKIKDGYNTNPLGLVLFKPYVKNCSLNPVGIKENSISQILIYPNPVTDRLVIKGSVLSSEGTISIINAIGKTVVQIIGNQNYIDTSSLVPGLYTLLISENGKNHLSKIVKE